MLHNTHMQMFTHTLLNSKMSKLYIFQALVAFVTSLVGIFIPVYLFSIGYSFLMILLYSMCLSLVYVISVPTVIYIINKIGLKWTLLLSSPFYSISLISIQLLSYNPMYFHLLWLSQGINVALFWISFRAEVLSNGNRRTRGNEVGTLQIIATLLTAIGPVIGGIFLEVVSYWALLIFASLFLIISNYPLIISKNTNIHKINFNYSDYLRIIKKKKTRNAKIAHMSEGIELTLSYYIWPIILFVLLQGNFASLGLFYTGLSILTILVLVYLKSYIDSHNKKKVLSLSAKLLSIGWFGRVILTLFGSVFIYLVESFTKLVSSVVTLTFTSIYYNNTSPNSYFEAILTRVLYLHGFKVIFCFVLILLLLLLGDQFNNLIIVLSIGILSSAGLNFLVEGESY